MSVEKTITIAGETISPSQSVRLITDDGDHDGIVHSVDLDRVALQEEKGKKLYSNKLLLLLYLLLHLPVTSSGAERIGLRIFFKSEIRKVEVFAKRERKATKLP